VKRIVLLGMTLVVGAALGCSGGSVAEAQPKNADPNAKSKVSFKGVGAGAAGAKTGNAIKD
jgi:hypothetical protein